MTQPAPVSSLKGDTIHRQDKYRRTSKGIATHLRYRNSDKGKAKKAASKKAWRKRYPEKWAAHQAVTRAIRAGALVRPNTCEHCGSTDRAIQASHTDYARRLDVEWLCPPCHRVKDKES